MQGLARVRSWFQTGRLVRPRADVPNFVDLVRALAELSGARGLELSPAGRELAEVIGPADHYVLVLVDGLGLKLLETLPADGFLRKHLARTLQAVFPPTTAAALNTLATGLWPAEHAVPGWWTYLAERRLSAITLPFVERFTERPLEAYGVSTEEVFPAPCFWLWMERRRLVVAPKKLIGTTFSRYATGDSAHLGYESLAQAVAFVVDGIKRARSSSFTYLYLPQIDKLAHRKGIADPGMPGLLAATQEHLADLAGALPRHARLIITADHGLIDTPEERRFVLPEGHPLLQHLLCPPTCEPTVPAFHARPGQQEAFLEAFTAHLGQHFALITPEEAEELRLFGPGPISPLLRRRLGDFIGLSAEPAAIYYHGPKDSHVHVGVHAGLSAQEMLIPLILT